VEREFLPWLVGAAADELHQQVAVRRLLDDMLRHVMSTRRALMDDLEAQFLLIQTGTDDALVRITTLTSPQSRRSCRHRPRSDAAPGGSVAVFALMVDLETQFLLIQTATDDALVRYYLGKGVLPRLSCPLKKYVAVR